MDRSFRKNSVAMILVVIALISFSLSAGNDEELFLLGSKYYEQHDYDNALQSYSMMSNKGRAVLYNMGNCFCHKQEYAQALVYWLRSERGATLHESDLIAHNKQYVLKKIGKNNDDSFVQRIKKILNFIAFSFSLFFLQIFFLICWFLFLYLAVKRKNFTAKVGFLLLFVFAMNNAVLLSIRYRKNFVLDGIVVKKNSVLFTGPDKAFHCLSQVPYADRVAIKEVRQGWYKIQYADIIGWVEADVIEII